MRSTGWQPAAVVEHAGELGDPRPHAVGGALGDPETDLRLALHRVLPAIRLLEPDAEDAADRPASHHRAQFLRSPPVVPRRRQAAPRLVVGELDRRQLAGRLEIGRAVRDEARTGVGGAHRRVPLLPELGEPRLAPLEELAPYWIARVAGARQGRAGRRLEVLLAVNAVAVAALRRPAVGEDAVNLVLRHDLAMDAVHEVEVVRPERAGHPEIGIRPVPQRRAVARRRDPVGVGGAHLVADGVRIGTRDDLHALRAAARDQRPERIAVAKPCAAMVQRNLGRVVGDDAAGAQRGSVGVKPAEVVEPELRIEAPGIVLDQRQLHPAHRPIEPALCSDGRCG